MKRLILILSITFLLCSCSNAKQRDPQLYEGAPQELLLQPDALPGSYLLMENLSGERPNEELTMEIDTPEALDQYLERTGRITGWENRFMLIETTHSLPGFIMNQVVIYKSPDGAQAALNWPVAQSRQNIESERHIGDAMTFTMMPFDAPDDSSWIDYRIEFTYENILGAISTYAPEDVATPDYALDLAEILYQHFQAQIAN